MDFQLSKPAIATDKILSKPEQRQVEIALKESGCRLIHCELKPAKNDYFDDHFRGTVEYTPKCRNYSFHKVIIPDGMIIKETNFTQREIDTDAIQGEDLVFESCNLVNNKINPSWRLESCNTCQVDFAKREAEELAKAEKVALNEPV